MAKPSFERGGTPKRKIAAHLAAASLAAAAAAGYEKTAAGAVSGAGPAKEALNHPNQTLKAVNSQMTTIVRYTELMAGKLPNIHKNKEDTRFNLMLTEIKPDQPLYDHLIMYKHSKDAIPYKTILVMQSELDFYSVKDRPHGRTYELLTKNGGKSYTLITEEANSNKKQIRQLNQALPTGYEQAAVVNDYGKYLNDLNGFIEAVDASGTPFST